jgi:hypothetical protein
MKVSLHFSTAYHPESDGQTKWVNQCLEQYLHYMAFSEPKNGSTGFLLLNGGITAVIIPPLRCLPFKHYMNAPHHS